MIIYIKWYQTYELYYSNIVKLYRFLQRRTFIITWGARRVMNTLTFRLGMKCIHI
jgi:hypothetical protein